MVGANVENNEIEASRVSLVWCNSDDARRESGVLIVGWNKYTTNNESKKMNIGKGRWGGVGQETNFREAERKMREKEERDKGEEKRKRSQREEKRESPFSFFKGWSNQQNK
jgi:hypothetical protein